jgi:hypothetical protein
MVAIQKTHVTFLFFRNNKSSTCVLLLIYCANTRFAVECCKKYRLQSAGFTTLSGASGAVTTDTVRNNWQTVAALFGLVAPIGYGAAYLREWGFCSVFGIPIEFIQVNVTTVLIAITSGVGVLFFLFWVADLFYTLSRQKKLKNFGPVKRRLLFDVLFLVIFGCLFALFPPLIYTWPLLLPFLFFLVFTQFVAPLITQKQIPGYISKLEAQDRVERETPLLLDYVVKRAGITIVSLGILVAMFLCAMFLLGYSTAERQTDFLVPSTHQDSVVLRIYGDNLVCAPFDIKTKEVDKTFFIIKLDDEPRPQLRLVRLGPLTSPKIWIPKPQD